MCCILYYTVTFRCIIVYEVVFYVRFVEEYYKEPNRGYGGNVITVFKSLQRENCQNPYGPAEEQFDGKGSYGNGGAMRISPGALFAIKRKPEEVDVSTLSSFVIVTLP